MSYLSGPARLRSLLLADKPFVAPLALDPLSARWAEAEGFPALYLGGGSLGYANVGTEANLSLTTMSHTALMIRAATSLPIILDGTSGWGDPMHVHHTIAVAEAAGFAAIEIEDQIVPRRAHHHVGKEHLIPLELMVEKVKAAVEARRDPDFVIIARTNALRSSTMDEALRRAAAMREAGADVLYVLQREPAQAREVGQALDCPLFYAMSGGVPSIGMELDELGELGFRIINDAVTPFLAAQKAMRDSYRAIKEWKADPTLGEHGYSEGTQRIHTVIDLARLLEIERRTVEK